MVQTRWQFGPLAKTPADCLNKSVKSEFETQPQAKKRIALCQRLTAVDLRTQFSRQELSDSLQFRVLCARKP